MLALVILSALVFVADVKNVYAVPPSACFAPFRSDDCGMEPKPVMYYWKPGSRCEVGMWRGCLPNTNMFPDEYECVATCIFAMRASMHDYHSLNEIEKDSEEATKDPYDIHYPTDELNDTDAAKDTDDSTTESGEGDNATTDANKTYKDTKEPDGDSETVTDDNKATDGASTEKGDNASSPTEADKPKVTLAPILKSLAAEAEAAEMGKATYACEPECKALTPEDITCKNGADVVGVTATVDGKEITIATGAAFADTMACVCMAKFTFSSGRKNGDKMVVEKVVAAIDNAVVTLKEVTKEKSPKEKSPLVTKVSYTCAAECAASLTKKVTENGVEITAGFEDADTEPVDPDKKERIITFTIEKEVSDFEGVYQAVFSDGTSTVTKTVLEIGLTGAARK